MENIFIMEFNFFFCIHHEEPFRERDTAQQAFHDGRQWALYAIQHSTTTHTYYEEIMAWVCKEKGLFAYFRCCSAQKIHTGLINLMFLIFFINFLWRYGLIYLFLLSTVGFWSLFCMMKVWMCRRDIKKGLRNWFKMFEI